MWTMTKPTEPGAYWVRGFSIGDIGDEPSKALVEVAIDEDGNLFCNLHESNSRRSMRHWYAMTDLDERFEWLGPLTPNC